MDTNRYPLLNTEMFDRYVTLPRLLFLLFYVFSECNVSVSVHISVSASYHTLSICATSSNYVTNSCSAKLIQTTTWYIDTFVRA